MSRRIGRFYLSMKVLEERQPEDCLNLMHGMFVVQASSQFNRSAIEYIGIHQDFEELPEGMWAPTYEAVFDSKSIYPTWRKIV